MAIVTDDPFWGAMLSKDVFEQNIPTMIELVACPIGMRRTIGDFE